MSCDILNAFFVVAVESFTSLTFQQPEGGEVSLVTNRDEGVVDETTWSRSHSTFLSKMDEPRFLDHSKNKNNLFSVKRDKFINLAKPEAISMQCKYHCALKSTGFYYTSSQPYHVLKRKL